MEDVSTCPICNNKLRTVRLTNKYLHPLKKTATFFERTCGTGMNHSLQFFADEKTHQIDFLKFSLDHKYSKFLEVDFLHQTCRISCLKMGEAHYIEIPKMVELDFPNLERLKERIAMYVVFS
jgi:hypothetical protein